MNPEMNQHQEEEPNSSSGLLRFRSVPSRLASQSLFEDDFEESKPLANGFNSLNSQLQLPPQYLRQSSATQLAAMDSGGSFRVTGSAVSSSLMRQSSSPPGFFSHLPAQNGYGTISGFGNYKAGTGSNGDTSLSLNRLRGLMNFSTGVSSSLGMFSQISEIEPESADGSCREDIKLGYGSRDPQFYSGYALGSWNEPSHFQESFSMPKRDIDINGKLFAGTQNRELENHRTHFLSHHLSLPKTSAEMAAVDKLLQFQDTVPCKVRAKRGCATHPRSIAERLRRTRISERMRKLQELVPNMDKQTNTAEMLDLAVEYIKDLQKQYKALSENRASCKCSSMQKPLRNLPPA